MNRGGGGRGGCRKSGELEHMHLGSLPFAGLPVNTFISPISSFEYGRSVRYREQTAVAAVVSVGKGKVRYGRTDHLTF